MIEIEGDYIFNNCDRIVRVNDHSEKAYYMMQDCHDLIQQKKRWPDYMNIHPSVVNTWARRIINQIWNKLRFKYYKLTGKTIGRRLPYRYQGRMVRDIYIAFAPVAIMHYSVDLIENIKPVWYVYTPSFWTYWNYLKTRDVKYLKRYRFWRKMWFKSKKKYVIRLNELREIAIKLIQDG